MTDEAELRAGGGGVGEETLLAGPTFVSYVSVISSGAPGVDEAFLGEQRLEGLHAEPRTGKWPVVLSKRSSMRLISGPSFAAREMGSWPGS